MDGAANSGEPRPGAPGQRTRQLKLGAPTISHFNFYIFASVLYLIFTIVNYHW